MKFRGKRLIRDTPYFEVHVSKCNTYKQIIEKAAKQLNLEGDLDEFQLVKASGAIILNKPVQLHKDVFVDWTLYAKSPFICK